MLKRWKSLPGYLVSVGVHGILMLLLLHLYLPNPFRAFQEILFQPGFSEHSEVFVKLGSPDASTGDLTDVFDGDFIVAVPVQTAVTQAIPMEFATPALPGRLQTNSWASTASEHTTMFTDSRNSGFGGRGDGKGLLLTQYGGSEGSEKSVALGLEWLAAHQNPNGSWSYKCLRCKVGCDKPRSECKRKCHTPNLHTSSNSATALAILPFLGSGITPQTGDARYRQVVDRGLKFLLQNGKRRPEGLSFIDSTVGPMYHHGITTIAICEAAAMTQDATLQEAAQQAVNFICQAQIPTDGGWRYQPRDPLGGNTSVFGWQIMALKSGQIGGVHVPNEVFFKAQRFLDSVVGIDQDSMYGYESSGDLHVNRGVPIEYRRATSAIGLLSRMYMGWNADHPSLIRGIEYLAAKGPDSDNLYYNYYATQVMHHYGGEAWKRWNLEQRDSLIARQTLEGHERGSWYFCGQWNDEGGRLYTTSLAMMILEVYYRHLPLYQKQAAESEFPLD